MAAWEIWRGRDPLVAAGLIEFTPLSELIEAATQPTPSYTSRTPEEIEVEMLPVVAAYERRRA